MKIRQISIENYRSIRTKVTLLFSKIGDKECFVLLGINESGKSNILNAVALLDKNVVVNYANDCNQEAEEEGESISVGCLLEIVNKKFYLDELVKAGMAEELSTIIDFKEIWRRISFDKTNRTDWHEVLLADSEFYEAFTKEGDKIVPLTSTNEQKDETGKILNALTKEEVEEFVAQKLNSVFENNTPKSILWKLESKYLINAKIDLNAFKEDPSISVPLRNCFRIADITGNEKIKTKIESIVSSPSKTSKLQELLGEKVTAHINDVWGEHKIRIKFAIDGMQLSFLVEDKDNHLPKYEVDKRSDGFKHFISILLNLSAENKTASLKNRIILLDEPEIHLHPSGQKYLRDELLKIAENNVVLYATHSIFMVDTKNLDRHLSIKKIIGMTKAIPIERDNPYREEVLFEAMGTSALEVIEPNVLLFEGKTDRDIFELYARKFKKEIKSPKVSLISADSCESIIKYTKFFNNKVVKGFVLVDSDAGGKKEKEKILREEGYNKRNTFEINDVLKTDKDSTLEDLFQKKYLVESVKEMSGLEIELDETLPFISQIKTKLQENRKPYKEEEKEILRQFFFKKISKLSKEELKSELYYGFCEKLCAKISAA